MNIHLSLFTRVTRKLPYFNVSAYPEDPSWQVTLVQGKVAVQIADHEEKILQPSEQYSLNNNTGEIEIKTVETELYTSWLDGKFYFKGYRFEDIVRKLVRFPDALPTRRNQEYAFPGSY